MTVKQLPKYTLLFAAASLLVFLLGNTVRSQSESAQQTEPLLKVTASGDNLESAVWTWKATRAWKRSSARELASDYLELIDDHSGTGQAQKPLRERQDSLRAAYFRAALLRVVNADYLAQLEKSTSGQQEDDKKKPAEQRPEPIIHKFEITKEQADGAGTWVYFEAKRDLPRKDSSGKWKFETDVYERGRLLCVTQKDGAWAIDRDELGYPGSAESDPNGWDSRVRLWQMHYDVAIENPLKGFSPDTTSPENCATALLANLFFLERLQLSSWAAGRYTAGLIPLLKPLFTESYLKRTSDEVAAAVKNTTSNPEYRQSLRHSGVDSVVSQGKDVATVTFKPAQKRRSKWVIDLKKSGENWSITCISIANQERVTNKESGQETTEWVSKPVESMSNLGP